MNNKIKNKVENIFIFFLGAIVSFALEAAGIINALKQMPNVIAKFIRLNNILCMRILIALIIVAIIYVTIIIFRSIYKRKYYYILGTERFCDWKIEVIEKLYGDKCDLVNIFNITRPCCTLECQKPIQIDDFLGCLDLGILNTSNQSPASVAKQFVSMKYVKQLFPGAKLQRALYNQIVGSNIHYPKLTGFLLDNYTFDENDVISNINCKIGTYEQNVYTSYILEYELYLAYNKIHKNIEDGITIPSNIIDYLPMRKQIHSACGDKAIHLCGDGRYSLLSVQLMFVYYDVNKGEYCSIIKKRSNNVSHMQGWYQFGPAGEFELYEKSKYEYNVDYIKESFSLVQAIYREYLEEIHNLDVFKGMSSEDQGDPAYAIFNNEHIKDIRHCLELSKAKFEFLGIAQDLVYLKHQLLFVLRIDDPDFPTNFKYNDEFEDNNGKAGTRTKIRDIEKIFDGEKKIHPVSSAMYSLFVKSNVFKEIVDNNFKLIR